MDKCCNSCKFKTVCADCPQDNYFKADVMSCYRYEAMDIDLFITQRQQFLRNYLIPITDVINKYFK